MKIKTVLAALAIGLLLTACGPGLDHLKFAEERLFPCVHPIDKFNKAEYLGAPETKGESTTAQVRIYYSGLLRQHNMTVEITTKRDLVKAQVINDTNLIPNVFGCKYVIGWQPIK